jgi:hypothetical protein
MVPAGVKLLQQSIRGVYMPRKEGGIENIACLASGIIGNRDQRILKTAVVKTTGKHCGVPISAGLQQA